MNHYDCKTRDEWLKHFCEFDCEECRNGNLPKFKGDEIIGWHSIIESEF